MDLSGRQIKAARALLDMSQEQLAQLAGLTPQGIRKIEDGSSQPREGTMADIMRVFSDRRLEFLDNEGVKFRSEGLELLNGAAGLEKFFNHAYSHAANAGGIIRQNGIEDTQFMKICAPDFIAKHRKRMEDLVASRKDVYVRAILKEGDFNFICDEYADYRWHPKQLPPQVPYYIVGDTISIFAWESDPSPKIIMITSPAISMAYSRQFDSSWDLALIPPES